VLSAVINVTKTFCLVPRRIDTNCQLRVVNQLDILEVVFANVMSCALCAGKAAIPSFYKEYVHLCSRLCWLITNYDLIIFGHILEFNRPIFDVRFMGYKLFNNQQRQLTN
jgi:hypothetical protein